MFDGVKKLWRETYGIKKPQKTQRRTEREYEAPRRVSRPVSEERYIEKEIISEPIREADYRRTLDNIKNLRDLNDEYSDCPQQFEDVLKEYFLKRLDKTDDIEELADVYNNLNIEGTGEKILDRYQQILPDFLVGHDPEELEGLFRDCPGQERFGESIKKRYEELLDGLKSFDDLEERRNECPEEFNDLFRGPYQKLLHTVDSIGDLEEHLGNCPEEFNVFFLRPYQKLLEKVSSLDDLEEHFGNSEDCFKQLFPGPYRLLLEKENSLSDLEDRLNNCPEYFNGLVIARYGEVLRTETSIKELDNRLDSASELFHGLLYARYQEILPSVMEKIPANERKEFCENIREDCNSLAITCSEKLLEK